MTNKEVKLELAKVAIPHGVNLQTCKGFYDWITEEPEVEMVDPTTPWDNTPIEELAYKTYAEGQIIKRSKENGINTVGDLIRCGAHKFATFHLVGRGTISKINDALEEYYNIKNWYTT